MTGKGHTAWANAAVMIAIVLAMATSCSVAAVSRSQPCQYEEPKK